MGFLPHPEASAAYDPVVEPWESPKTWQTVADELRHHRSEGLGALLTEDTVRFATARALVAEGMDPAGLSLGGSTTGLAGGGDPPTVLVEVALRREPNETLQDLYRLAVAPTDAVRLLVDVAAPDRQLVESELAATLLVAWAVDDGLRLSVYSVDRIATVVDELPEPPRRTSTRDGARREILAAVTRILARSGQKTFSPVEVVRELQDAGTTYAETTIRTMVVSHMCVNAPDDAAVTYDDFECLEHGVYRLAP